MSQWHEDLWASVPADAVPERFATRRELLLREVRSGQSVLDLGCGDGSFSAELLSAGAEVTGVDVADEAIRRAKVRAPAADLLKLDDRQPLPFGDDQFDLVWCGETLEHLVDPGAMIAEARRVLKDGGLFLVTTPNQARLRVAFEALAGRPLEDRLDPRSDHLRFFTARTLKLMISDAGFHQVFVNSFGGLPLLRSSLLASAR